MCTHTDRHQVKFDVYKEDKEGNDVFVNTQTCIPGLLHILIIVVSVQRLLNQKFIRCKAAFLV